MTTRLLRTLVDALCTAALVVSAPTPSRAADHSVLLVELDSEGSLAEWWSVDDRVMGGISRSSVEQAATNTVRFAGTLSLDQGGGFASTRRSLGRRGDLSAWNGIALRVRGDGRSYQLRLRTDGEYDGIAYRAPFPTRAGEWTDVRVAFDAFVPTWRGRRLSNVPALNPHRVESLGFMVSGEQEGFFELEIARVEAWRTPHARRE